MVASPHPAHAHCAHRPNGTIVIVCHCKVVSDRTIGSAVADGARTLAAVCSATGAGRDCGTCIFSVKAVVRQQLDRHDSLAEVDGAAS